MALLKSHGPSLHALLLRLTLRHDVAEDLMQDLAIKLASAPGFAQASHPHAYARRAATNLACDWRRSSRSFENAESIDALPDPRGHGIEIVLRAQRLDRLLDALSRLPEPTRQVVVMRYLEQKSYAVIAAELNENAGALRMTCHRAICRLRDMLDARAKEVAHASP